MLPATVVFHFPSTEEPPTVAAPRLRPVPSSPPAAELEAPFTSSSRSRFTSRRSSCTSWFRPMASVASVSAGAKRGQKEVSLALGGKNWLKNMRQPTFLENTRP